MICRSTFFFDRAYLIWECLGDSLDTDVGVADLISSRGSLLIEISLSAIG